MSEYADPSVLVSTDWVSERLNTNLKIVEVDVDTQQYAAGHIPGAVSFDWTTELQDQVSRDIISKADFEKLLGEAGIGNDDEVVIYGDNNNWFAAYALWVFKYYGHENVKLMNGGRSKWLDEEDKPLTTDAPSVSPTAYTARGENAEIRAFVQDVLKVVSEGKTNLVDVRSTDEFTGKVIAPAGMTETAQRGGHVPGAKSVPWVTAVNPDGTFKSRPELEKIYFEDAGVNPENDTIAYCRIGERSSHTWFVLKYLLGIDNVKNYDGSWTEYGSMIGVPIEK
ncbi:MAG: sulfurtransferase [Planctomycetota bacterium]